MDLVTAAAIAVFVFGTAVGSFLNVCIARLPEGASVVKPASRCPKCGHAIRFYDNIPLLSYLILRGKCRDCKEPIGARYPLVELGTGLLALAILWRFGPTVQALVAFAFAATLLTVTAIDFETQLIPHRITLPGIPIFLVLGVFVMGTHPADALIGLMSGIGILYLVAVYYEALTDQEGMGGGDVNLLGLMGGFLGWKALLLILLVGAFAGAAVGLALMARRGKDLKYALPFGPFLSLGGLVALFAGRTVLGWLSLPV